MQQCCPVVPGCRQTYTPITLCWEFSRSSPKRLRHSLGTSPNKLTSAQVTIMAGCSPVPAHHNLLAPCNLELCPPHCLLGLQQSGGSQSAGIRNHTAHVHQAGQLSKQLYLLPGYSPDLKHADISKGQQKSHAITPRGSSGLQVDRKPTDHKAPPGRPVPQNPPTTRLQQSWHED